MNELKVKLLERMPGAKLAMYIGYEEGNDASAGQASRWNGRSTKLAKGWKTGR